MKKKLIVSIIAYLSLCGAAAFAGVAIADHMATPSPVAAQPQPEQGALVADENQAPITMPLTTTGNAVLVSTPVGTMTWTVSNTVGTVQTFMITAPSPPQLAISCSDANNCTVNAADRDQAIALLERIANRSVTMDVVYYGHDNNCQPQHEIIAAKPDIVAER